MLVTIFKFEKRRFSRNYIEFIFQNVENRKEFIINNSNFESIIKIVGQKFYITDTGNHLINGAEFEKPKIRVVLNIKIIQKSILVFLVFQEK